MKLTSTNLDDPPSPQQTEQDAELPIWLQRAFLVVYVLFCIGLGLLLVELPWSRIWFDDGPMMHWPALRHLLQHGFVRGAVSGLGIIDIWIGIMEAVHYREKPVNPSLS